MTERSNQKFRTKRKLDRRQIVEILERNVLLYKDEDNFAQYIVELALYLLMYEYNWDDAGTPHPEALDALAGDGFEDRMIEFRGGKIIQKKIEPGVKQSRSRICPFCGIDAGDQMVCPSCQNLTR